MIGTRVTVSELPVPGQARAGARAWKCLGLRVFWGGQSPSPRHPGPAASVGRVGERRTCRRVIRVRRREPSGRLPRPPARRCRGGGGRRCAGPNQLWLRVAEPGRPGAVIPSQVEKRTAGSDHNMMRRVPRYRGSSDWELAPRNAGPGVNGSGVVSCKWVMVQVATF